MVSDLYEISIFAHDIVMNSPSSQERVGEPFINVISSSGVGLGSPTRIITTPRTDSEDVKFETISGLDFIKFSTE